MCFRFDVAFCHREISTTKKTLTIILRFGPTKLFDEKEKAKKQLPNFLCKKKKQIFHNFASRRFKMTKINSIDECMRIIWFHIAIFTFIRIEINSKRELKKNRQSCESVFSATLFFPRHVKSWSKRLWWTADWILKKMMRSLIMCQRQAH